MTQAEACNLTEKNELRPVEALREENEGGRLRKAMCGLQWCV